VEQLVALATGMHTATTLDGVVVATDAGDQAKRHARVVGKWLTIAKLHFGEVRDTPADRIAVKRWLAEQMKGADMRDSDAVKYIPMVVELMWTPLIGDIVAARMRDSRVVAALKMLAPQSGA
jgi:hypothetical protein